MAAWALYRLPHADHYVRIRQTSGEPEALLSCAQLNGREGFVVAPFDIRPDQPVLLIRPDAVEAYPLPGKSGLSVLSGKSGISSPSPSYAVDFANFHAQLLSGTLRKIVLARCADESTACPLAPEELFFRACQRYPRLFISLVYTSLSGYWLTATPEILLENDGPSGVPSPLRVP